MSRLTFGPSQGSVVVAPTDVVVTIASVVGSTVTASVSGYSPALNNMPTFIHACFLAAAPPAGQTPAQCLAGATLTAQAPFSGNATYPITVPNVPAGTYFVQVIVEYAA